MNSKQVNRRQFVIATTAGLGVLVPDIAAQTKRQEPKPPYPPQDAGPIHGDMLRRISEDLAGSEITAKEGLLKLVAMLRQTEVITDADASMLREMIDIVFSELETAGKKLQELLDDAEKKAGEVTVAIVSIAKESVDFAKKHGRAIFIVSSDISGALSGAATGAKLGGQVLAVVGAVAGAVASSAGAAFKH